jgi:hypothetical protein
METCFIAGGGPGELLLAPMGTLAPVERAGRDDDYATPVVTIPGVRQ